MSYLEVYNERLIDLVSSPDVEDSSWTRDAVAAGRAEGKSVAVRSQVRIVDGLNGKGGGLTRLTCSRAYVGALFAC